jgi:hypothetical protein
VGAERASGGGEEQVRLENVSARRSMQRGDLSSTNTAVRRIRVIERGYNDGCTGTRCGRSLIEDGMKEWALANKGE